LVAGERVLLLLASWLARFDRDGTGRRQRGDDEARGGSLGGRRFDATEHPAQWTDPESALDRIERVDDLALRGFTRDGVDLDLAHDLHDIADDLATLEAAHLLGGRVHDEALPGDRRLVLHVAEIRGVERGHHDLRIAPPDDLHR